MFADNYKLPDLEEVESFIAANQHLPNIPSACEVEENGIDVAGMQVKMMEKIEELTLYLIDQNKQLQELKKQNEEQKCS